MKAMKGKLQYTSVEKIDEQIAKLEDMQQHSSLSIAEEKKVVENIRALRASRASVAEYAGKLTQLDTDDSARSAAMDRLKALDEKLNGIKAQMDKCREELEALREKENAGNSDIPALKAEREEAREIINALYEKKRQIWGDYKAKVAEWRETDKLWRVQRDEDRKRKYV